MEGQWKHGFQVRMLPPEAASHPPPPAVLKGRGYAVVMTPTLPREGPEIFLKAELLQSESYKEMSLIPAEMCTVPRSTSGTHPDVIHPLDREVLAKPAAGTAQVVSGRRHLQSPLGVVGVGGDMHKAGRQEVREKFGRRTEGVR